MSDRDQPSLEPSSVKKEHKHHHKSKKHAEGKEHERHSTRRSTKHADSSAKKVNHEKTNAKPDDGLKEIPFGPEPETSWPPKNWHLLDQALTQLEYYQKYGPVYGVKIMGNNFYVIADPDLVREIGADSTMWGKSGSKESPIFSQWHNIRGNCGISVIDDGEQYQKIRGILLNFYNPKNQGISQFPKMGVLAKQLALALEQLPKCKSIDLREWFTRYAVAAVGGFSKPFNMLSLDAQKTKFATNVPACLREATLRIVTPNLSTDPEKDQAFKSNCGYVRDEVARIIKDRQSGVMLEKDETDLLSIMLTKTDPKTGQKLEFEEMHHQILVQLSNGFNGPSITLTWCVYLLSHNPECEDRLLAEIDAVNGAEGENHVLTVKDLDNMPYMTMVLKECLRLYPPLPISIRNALSDGKLGPYRIKKGDTVIIGHYSLHKNPDLWPNPDAFDPERFLPENIAKQHPAAHVPFSVGQRQCMGQQLSFMTMKTLLWALYSRFRFRAKVMGAPQTLQAVLISPGGIEMTVHRRVRQAPIVAPPAAEPKKFLHHDPAAKRKPVLTKRTTFAAEVLSKLKLVILYGTTFGTCQDLADKLSDQAVEFGFAKPVVAPLNDYLPKLAELKPDNDFLVIIVAATYTGLPANSANQFSRWINTDSAKKAVPNMKYCIFGVGNGQWTTYQAFPNEVDTKFRNLKAKSVFRMGKGDVAAGDWENEFFTWSSELWDFLTSMKDGNALSEAHRKRSLTNLAAAATNTKGADIFLTDPKPDQKVTHVATPIKIGTYPVNVSRNDELQTPGSEGSTRLIEVILPEDVAYEVGDHLGICPSNDPEEVKKVAARIGVDIKKVFALGSLSSKFRHLPPETILSVENVLTNLLDLHGPPPRNFLAMLAAGVKDAKDKEYLELVASNTPQGTEAFQTHITKNLRSTMDLLFEFPSARITFEQLVDVCPLIKPRYYSISSSPAQPGLPAGGCQITTSLLHQKTAQCCPRHAPHQFYGFSSRFLNKIKPGTKLHVFINPALEFHLPSDLTKPIVMIGAGTGLAPFMGYLETLRQAKAAGVKIGENALFFGCRKSNADYIYRAQLESYLKDGTISHLQVAFSREDPKKVEYVQHKFEQCSALAWNLVKEGAYVYVCGSKSMREEVKKAAARIIMKESGMNEAETTHCIIGLWAGKHYVEDVWG